MLFVSINPTVFDTEPWKSCFPTDAKRKHAVIVLDSSSADATQATVIPHFAETINGAKFVSGDTNVRKHVIGINGIYVDEANLKSQFDTGDAVIQGGGLFLNQLAAAVARGMLLVSKNGAALTANDLYTKNF